MKRSAKVCWVGFVFSTIVIAAVAGLVIYFTAFNRETTSSDGSSFAPVGGTSSSEVTGTEGGAPGDGSQVSLVDHLSHSVPGFEYRDVDYDGDGFALVQLDGSRSHTHYYNEGPPIVIGKLVEHSWFDNATREPLASGAKPLVEFPVGTTVVGLTVSDNYRDSHTDYTTVVVEKPIADGVYCYYYPASDDGQISISDDLGDGEKPTFAAVEDGLAFEDDSAFPSTVSGSKFQARCVFTLEVEEGGGLEFTLEHFGPVRMLAGDEVVLESSSTDLESSSGSFTPTDSKTITVQVLYSRPSSAAAKLELTEGGDDLRYDMSAVLPVLLTIDPKSSTLVGGGSAKLDGLGLLNAVTIEFGGEEVEVDTDTSTNTRAFFTVPGASRPEDVSVQAKNRMGTSNSLTFTYSSEGLAPVKFKEARVTMDGKTLSLPLLTGIKYGPDHRFYASAINNVVHSFAVNSKMQAMDLCKSPSVGKFRSILGLAFNPAETELKLYVSASVLDWKREKKLTGPDAWANGEILMLMKDINGECLDKVDDPIISGLPVSNHDHGVNGLVFDQDGKLHIQVGGFTNAGHNDAKTSRLGGMDENPLSGASLIAPVMDPGFDGRITYSSTDPGTAVVTGGDVKVYSPGWRNSFGIEWHSNGFLYATDNGASVGFGDKSVSCDSHESFGNENLEDKLGKVIEGKFFGHPNRNRGRTDPEQCKFHELSEPSSGDYLAPLAIFESSTDGIMEYTASVFGGQMKGNLLCSKYSTQESSGKVFRVELDDEGEVLNTPVELSASSGLSITMSPWGHVLMPRVYKTEIISLAPSYEVGTSPMFIAVSPFRGPAGGGNVVLVTGENLGSSPTALFDGEPCGEVSDIAADERSFMCVVPGGSPGKGVEVTLRVAGTTVASTGGVDYRYMNI